MKFIKLFFRTIYIFTLFLMLCTPCIKAQVIYTKENRPSAPALSDLPLTDTLSQYGITWKFNKKVHVGKFITGSYYVVGPVTVVSVSPAPENGRNGSMLNGPARYESSYDSRGIGYSAKYAVNFPVYLKPGHSLISSISLKDNEKNHQPVLARHGVPQTHLRSAAVLTCLEAPVPLDAFRPSYSDTTARIYRAIDLHRELLPSLERVPRTPDLPTWERIFERPWIDHTMGWGNRETHPTDNMPEYSRETSRAVSVASLMLMCDFTPQQKEKLLLSFVQYGIDLWGVAKAGGGWEAEGGYGNGRKWPIILSGILLGDKEMERPNTTIPTVRFGEDEQTKYGDCWTGAKVVFAGHTPIGGKGDRGAYEHLQPKDWPGPLKTQSEGYRRCCTSISWIGSALAARIMNAEKSWNHDAYFDYCDRWMTEDDTKALEEIKKQLGKNLGGNRQGQTWDPFVDQMWAKYRNNLQGAK